MRASIPIIKANYNMVNVRVVLLVLQQQLPHSIGGVHCQAAMCNQKNWLITLLDTIKAIS